MKYEIVPVTPFEQNSTVLWCPETLKAAVCDPGGDLHKILAVIEREGLSLEKILVTHAHIDHVGAVGELSERYGLPIEGPHREDLFWIEGLPKQSTMFGFPAAKVFTPARWLEGGDTVYVGKQELQVLYCPGHTPGHVCFFHAPSRLAIVGDVLFNGSVGRSDFPRGDHATLINSIRTQLLTLGDEVAFIPGHGPMSTMGDERRFNPFLNGSA